MLGSSKGGIVWKLTNNCPSCNGKNIALIIWGYPPHTESFREALEKKEIVLGGCIVTDHDPKWKCNTCHHRWGERDDY